MSVTSQVDGGISQFLGMGPISYIISLWQDQTSFIASGVPIPAPLGSPAGPNLSHTVVNDKITWQSSH